MNIRWKMAGSMQPSVEKGRKLKHKMKEKEEEKIKHEMRPKRKGKIWPDFYILFKHFHIHYLLKPLISCALCSTCASQNAVRVHCMEFKMLWKNLESCLFCTFSTRKYYHSKANAEHKRKRQTLRWSNSKFVTINRKQMMLNKVWETIVLSSYCVRYAVFERD